MGSSIPEIKCFYRVDDERLFVPRRGNGTQPGVSTPGYQGVIAMLTATEFDLS
jgi:hypothetical protein